MGEEMKISTRRGTTEMSTHSRTAGADPGSGGSRSHDGLFVETHGLTAEDVARLFQLAAESWLHPHRNRR